MKEILILVDLQNDFVSPEGSLSNPECTAVVEKALKVLDTTNADTIIYTLDTHYDDYLDTLEGQKLPVPHCIFGTEGHKLIKEIDKKLSSMSMSGKVVIGQTKDTFGYTEWSRYISEGDVVEILGVCTGICVLSNATIIRALYPDNRIIVYSDCCACINKETHENALEVLKLQQCEVKNFFTPENA